jgi:hypothetical protein
MEEKWKPVPDEFFGKFFEVSDRGRIRSFEREVTRGGDKNRYTFIKPPCFISSRTNGKEPYLFCSLAIREDGIETRKTFYVHKVMAEAFLKRPSTQHVYVTHKDGDTFRNELSNLKWITASENSTLNMQRYPENREALKRHNQKSGYYKKIKSPARKKWRKILFLNRLGVDKKEIASSLGCSLSLVYLIIREKNI